MKKPINIKFWIILILLLAGIIYIYSDILFNRADSAIEELRLKHSPEIKPAERRDLLDV